WSNGLTSNAVNAGQALVIPPVNGIVYTVKAGDTPESLANKYKASAEQIIASNDAEIAGLKPGERILIPNGLQPAPVVNVRAATSGFAWGSSAIYGFNGYTFGYCTWYVANRVTVPANWGNANTWDNRAPMSGWVVGSIPKVGAIGQTDRGAEGHVGVIEAVSEDGTMIKYADMNGIAGWGREGRTTDWVSAAKFEHYIYQ
ncbi:MAG TPA: CHAP domain-containing protein, partial [Candidatus Limnocylindrales bacterium]|nr:CHAP domain-containing protein [Candidatus Limnocylindrales bacterium]